MFNEMEKKLLLELIEKEEARIERDFKDMEQIGESFYINEGLLFENMHVRKKLETRLESIRSAKEKIEKEIF